MRRFALCLILACFLLPFPAHAKKKVAAEESEEDKGPFQASTFTGLAFRGLGPGLVSGRVSDIAVDPAQPKRYFVAVASGGVWKTDNAGTTWTPVFDDQGSYSIGCVTLDPNHPNVVWVGTGENNSQRLPAGSVVCTRPSTVARAGTAFSRSTSTPVSTKCSSTRATRTCSTPRAISAAAASGR